jgi:hypothetical protein
MIGALSALQSLYAETKDTLCTPLGYGRIDDSCPAVILYDTFLFFKEDYATIQCLTYLTIETIPILAIQA